MCDTLCHVGDRGTLFAKSSDRPRGEAQVVEWHEARPGGGTVATQYLELPDPGAAAVIGSRPTWLWGFEHGVNEHGVAIGNEEVYTDLDAGSVPPALIGMDLVRLTLERARDADEALEVLTTLLGLHGQGGIANAARDIAYFSSFLVADGRSAWVVETSGQTWAARPVPTGGGSAISNRLSMGTDWTRASTDVAPGDDFQAHLDPEMPTGHADVRLAVTSRRAALGGDRWDAARTLRDHGTGDPTTGPTPLPDRRADFDGTGVSVCMHLRGFDATAAAMVAELPADRDRAPVVRAALGSPCCSVFVPVFVDVGAPSCLAEVATWQAAVAVRDGVEEVQDRTSPEVALELSRVVRAELDPVEVELDEAATAVAPDDAAGRREVHRVADDLVPAALARARRLVDAERRRT